MCPSNLFPLGSGHFVEEKGERDCKSVGMEDTKESRPSRHRAAVCGEDDGCSVRVWGLSLDSIPG